MRKTKKIITAASVLILMSIVLFGITACATDSVDYAGVDVDMSVTDLGGNWMYMKDPNNTAEYSLSGTTGTEFDDIVTLPTCHVEVSVSGSSYVTDVRLGYYPYTSVTAGAFTFNKTFKQVNITGTYKNINPYVFYRASITGASITPTVEDVTIGESAFYGCQNLEYVVLGENVTTIGENAFCECPNLSAVYYEGNVLEWVTLSMTASTDSVMTGIVRYYSERTPIIATGYTYWHYVDGVPTDW